MIIKLEEIKELGFLEKKINVNLSKKPVEDVLIKHVNEVNGKVEISLVDHDELLIRINLDYNVDYLDARSLKPLNLNFSITDDMMITSNLQKARELDIDFIEEELDLEELIFELIIVSIPFNYSEEKPIILEEQEKNKNEYNPFVNIGINEEE